MTEIWKDIPEYEGLYQISNLGNVRSQHSNRMNGQKPGKLLKIALMKNGYMSLELRMSDTNKRHLVHRLIAESFIPNPDNKPVVNHINGIKTDNRIENLEWCTHSENVRHAINTGLRGTSFGPAKGTKPWNTDKTLSKEHKDKLSKAKLGKPSLKKRKVIDTSTGIIYDGIQEAADAFGVKYSNMCGKLYKKNKINLRFYESN
jgi:transcriptional regulator of met regulon